MVRFDSEKYKNLDLISNESNKIPCVLCLSPVVDEVVYNKFLKTKKGTAAHFNCLIFSAGLKQSESDLEGIYGFTEEEIAKEIKRAKKLRCGYCHKSGATIGCCNLKCQVKFHYACGEAHGANYDFSGSEYKSFCRCHSAAPFSPAKLNLDEAICPICIEEFEDRRVVIKSSCCTQSNFHKRCLQMAANQAGYFFRCPVCTDDKVFLNDVKRQGIYVPQQDAEWEYAPNAYQELLQRYQHCDAKQCKCPKGPNYGALYGEWKIVRCNTCGAAGVHKHCGNLGRRSSWCCVDCTKVVNKGLLHIGGLGRLECLQLASSAAGQPLPAIPGTSRGCLNSFLMQLQQAGCASMSKRHVSSDECVAGHGMSERASTSKSAQPDTNEFVTASASSSGRSAKNVDNTKSHPPNQRTRAATSRKHIAIANEPSTSDLNICEARLSGKKDKVLQAANGESTTEEINSSNVTTSKKSIRRPKSVDDANATKFTGMSSSEVKTMTAKDVEENASKPVRKLKKVTASMGKGSAFTNRKLSAVKSKPQGTKQMAEPKSNTSKERTVEKSGESSSLEVQPVERTIYIAPEIRDLFPFCSRQIKNFSESMGIIPDWRMLYLGVQVVELFSKSIASKVKHEAPGAQSQQLNIAKSKTDNPQAVNEKESTPSQDKKHSRKGQWKFGVIRRKYTVKKTETTSNRVKKTAKVENAEEAGELVQPKRRSTRISLRTSDDITSDSDKMNMKIIPTISTNIIQESNNEEDHTLKNAKSVTDSEIIDLSNENVKTDEGKTSGHG